MARGDHLDNEALRRATKAEPDGLDEVWKRYEEHLSSRSALESRLRCAVRVVRAHSWRGRHVRRHPCCLPLEILLDDTLATWGRLRCRVAFAIPPRQWFLGDEAQLETWVA